MDYDKNSFLAGMSVGMTMKGWSSAGGIGSGSIFIFQAVEICSIAVSTYYKEES